MDPTKTTIDGLGEEGMELVLDKSTILVTDKHGYHFATVKRGEHPTDPTKAVFVLKPAVASWSALVKATDGSATGEFQLQVGELYLRSNSWDEKAAKKWLPLIVAAVNEKLVNQDT